MGHHSMILPMRICHQKPIDYHLDEQASAPPMTSPKLPLCLRVMADKTREKRRGEERRETCGRPQDIAEARRGGSLVRLPPVPVIGRGSCAITAGCCTDISASATSFIPLVPLLLLLIPLDVYCKHQRGGRWKRQRRPWSRYMIPIEYGLHRHPINLSPPLLLLITAPLLFIICIL